MFKVRLSKLARLVIPPIILFMLGVIAYRDPGTLSLMSMSALLVLYMYLKPRRDFDAFSLAVLLGLFCYPIYYVNKINGQDLAFIIPLALFFLELASKNFSGLKDIDLVDHYRLVMLILLVLSCVQVFSVFWLAFYLLASASIVPITKASKSIATPYLWLFLVLAALVLRGVFSWDGYGRLVYITYLFIPLVFAQRARILKIPIFLVPLCVGIGLYFMQAIRADSVDTLDLLLMGSAGHHIILTNDIIKTGSIYSISAFFEQYFLMFFNWLPRMIFPDKPIGIGFTSVYDIFPGAADFGSNYSHSVGFVGESALFFGDFFLIGLMFYAVGIFAINRLLQLLLSEIKVMVPVVIYMATLSYLWGGGAAFGGRIWQPTFALILCNIVLVVSKARFRGIK